MLSRRPIFGTHGSFLAVLGLGVDFSGLQVPLPKAFRTTVLMSSLLTRVSSLRRWQDPIAFRGTDGTAFDTLLILGRRTDEW